MENILLWGLLVVVIISLMYFMYINGWMVTQSKTAVFFRAFNGGMQARFKSCSGNIKRVFKFDHMGENEFELETELTNGNVIVEILNKQNEALVRLDNNNTKGKMEVLPKTRYFLKVTYENASGYYSITIK